MGGGGGGGGNFLSFRAGNYILCPIKLEPHRKTSSYTTAFKITGDPLSACYCQCKPFTYCTTPGAKFLFHMC